MLQIISEPQLKKKRQRYGNFDKIQRARICQMEYCVRDKTCSKEIWRSRVSSTRNYQEL